MLNIRPLMLTATFLVAACGSGPDGAPAPGPIPTNSGNQDNTNTPPTDSTDPDDLEPTYLTNNVEFLTQESTTEATKRTAAISCSFTQFSYASIAAGSTYKLTEPQRSTCQFGYKKHTANQKVSDYHAPSTIVKESPEFPAFLEIIPLMALGGQNTSGIKVSLPILPVINTNACHTAELRVFSQGEHKNFKLTRNKSDNSYFDINSTDFSAEFTKYNHDMISGYYGNNTRRDPVEVIYLCDWHESSKIEDDAISALDNQIADRTGAPATWSIKISQNDKVLKSLTETSAKSIYEVFAKHSFDNESTWNAIVTVKGKDGVILATNDQSAVTDEAQRSFWNEHCARIDSSLKLNTENYNSVVALNICDLSKALRNIGVKTSVANAAPPRKHFIAPIHCKVSKMQKYYDEVSTSKASRQVCDFAVPALVPELPLGANIGILKSWEPSETILNVGYTNVSINKINNEQVNLVLSDMEKFYNINRHDCRQAVLSFKTPEGVSKSIIFDEPELKKFGSDITFARSTKLPVNDEITAASELVKLRDHLGNTANATTDMDIYLLCSWWALLGESVTTL